MKNFKVTVIMIIGMSEEVHYHDFYMEAKDEISVFKKIKRKKWFHYTRETKATIKGVTKIKTYTEFIQTKHISDICISEVD